MAALSCTAWSRPGSCKSPRLQRLFGRDGKCLNVAIDHGIFGEARFLTGVSETDHKPRLTSALTRVHALAASLLVSRVWQIEDMTKVLEILINAGPDAIQLTPGAGKSPSARDSPFGSVDQPLTLLSSPELCTSRTQGRHGQAPPRARPAVRCSKCV